MQTYRRSNASAGLSSLAILTALTLTATAAMAETIGITSAVNLNAVGTPPQQDARVLQVGLDVFAEEKVDTGQVGQTHLIFDDGSALTIGPSSTVVLDEFVYDPDAQSGKLVASVGKGLMRFVGGKISKKTPVLFKTPNSLIGIRGGIALVESNTPAEVQAARAAGRDLPLSAVTLIFGVEAFMQVGDRTERMTRPGSRIVQRADGSIAPAAPVSQDTLDSALALLEDRGPADIAELVDTLGVTPQAVAQIAPAAGGAFGVGDDDIAASQLADLSSGNNPGSLVPPPPPGIDPVDFEEPTEIRIPDQAGSGSAIIDGTSPASTASLAGVLSGRVKHAFDPDLGTDDLLGFNIAFANATAQDGVFNAPTSPPLTLNFADGTFAATSTSQPFVDDTLIGTGELSADGQFLIYELDEVSFDHRVLAWAGVPTPASAFPTSGISFYTLRDDFVLSSAVPFVRGVSGGNVDVPGQGEAFIDWGAASGPKFGGSRIVIQGSGPSQTSAASLMVGRLFNTDNPQTAFISGSQRGSARLNGGAQSATYQGFFGVDRDGFGSNGNAFFGSDAPDYFTLINADGVVERIGATEIGFNPNVIAQPAVDEVETRSAQTLQGFAGGLVQVVDASGLLAQTYLVENDAAANAGVAPVFPSDVQITTNPADASVTAAFNLLDLDSQEDLELDVFLGGQFTGASAYLDDFNFGAVEDLSGGQFVAGNLSDPVDPELYFVTASVVDTQGFLPAGVEVCDCDFLTWGFWGGDLTDINGDRATIHLATWVAGGDPCNGCTLPTLGTAIFSGHMIGTVLNNGDVYLAAGGYNQTVNFGPSNSYTFDVDVTSFDGQNFSISGAPGTGGQFAAQATTGGRDLIIRGSFFGDGNNNPVAEVGGGFNINGANYQASGNFAAAQ